MTYWGKTCTAAVLLALASWAQAQAAIDTITGMQQDGRDVVRIEFTGPVDGTPQGFTLASPPRIAIDLPGVQAGNMGRNVPLTQGNVRGVRLAAAGDRTRVVLDLAEPVSFATSRDGNALLLTLEPGAPAPATTLAQAAPPPEAAPATPPAPPPKTEPAPPPAAEPAPARPAPRRRTSASAGASSAASARANVTLDFANAEIDAVARTMATITGRNVVVDPRVRGTMTLTSTTPVTPDNAMRLFAAQLRTQGFAVVENNGMHIVLPEAEAKLQSGTVSAGAPRASGGQIVTQIFRLTHENANNLVPILRPLISANNTINVNPGTNSLVITDYADNLQRLGRIIASLDVSNATGVEIVRLKHAVATDLAPLVARLLESGGSGAAVAAPAAPGQPAAQAALASGDSYRTTLVPEPRSNAIIVRAANSARLALAKTLIEQLDQPPHQRADGGTGNIHVVYLKNADATKLAVTLRAALAALPGQQASSAAGGGAGASGGSTAAASSGTPASTGSSNGNSLTTGPSINAAAGNQPSTGGQIQADPATNSLIISAPEPVYRELRAVIDKLDQRRAQVFIESLIAEVNLDRAADFGVQWQMFGRNGNNVGVIGTNYSTGRATGGTSTNILDIARAVVGYSNAPNSTATSNLLAAAMPNTGFNLALGTQALGILANFIQSTGAGNVLSTPTLLTLDNEEAKIIVGQNMPFVTGSYTNTGATGGTTLNPFQTYERQDVGLTLRVRPQISEDGTIKLVIYQESSNLQGTTAAGPVTRKRAIESSVLVDDGSVIVLGGLLEDQYESSVDKVPGLGDIPVLGNLFKSENRRIAKTNLMVFLRPVIVRDAASTENYSLDRYDMMRAAQQASQPRPSSVLQVNEAPLIPPVAPANPGVWSRPAPPPPLIRPAAPPPAHPAAGESNYYGPPISHN